MKKNLITAALLLFLPPVGAVLVWTTKWPRWAKLASSAWGILILFVAFAPSDETNQIAEQQSTAEQEQLEQAQDLQDEQNFEAALESFKAALAETDPNGNIVIAVDKGLVVGEAKITVSNQWFREPEQIQLQLAQTMWQVWSTLYAPDPIDKARIRLVDQNGNHIGGSRSLAGSLIYLE